MLRELNNDALLMLYLAGELPAGNRAELERRLAADAGLRAQLQAMQELIEPFEAGMMKLDATAPASEAVALRRIGNAMRQKMARHADEAIPEKTVVPITKRYPWWVYSCATAAAAAVIMVAWWGYNPPDQLSLPSTQPRVVLKPNFTDESKQASGDENQASTPADPFAPAIDDKNVALLETAEQQLAEVTRIAHVRADTQAKADPSYFGFDGNE